MNDRIRGLGLTASTAEFVAAVVRPDVRAQKAYVVAAAEGMVKLDANENALALPDAVKARVTAALAQVPLNRYPDGTADAARATLRGGGKLRSRLRPIRRRGLRRRRAFPNGRARAA